MSVLVPVTINGQTSINGQPLLAQAEYTSGPIVQQYQAAIEVFNDIFNLSSAQAETLINNGTYHTRIANSIAALNTIAANGVIDPADVGVFPQPIQPRRLTVQMVTAMDNLYRTLNIAGIPTDGSAVTVQQVKDWRNIAFSSPEVQSTLQLADAAAGAQNKTLQALTELVYVKQGNDILSQSLSSLENAISTTSTVLTTLNDLQQLHNQITAVDKISFTDYLDAATGISNRLNTRIQQNPFTFTAGIVADPSLHFYYESGIQYNPRYRDLPSHGMRIFSGLTYVYVDNMYAPKGTANWFRVGIGTRQFPLVLTQALDPQGDPSLFGFQIPALASKHFGALTPQVSSALANSINPYVLQFLDLRQKIASQIKSLSAITSNPNDPQTLLGRLRVIYSGMNKAINLNNGYMPDALKMWILDNQSAGVKVSAGTPNAAAINAEIDRKNNFGGPGDIQTAINNAITAGQNLNDTQKETTRRYMFVFEEYYKSASAILTKITDIITRMAQGISR